MKRRINALFILLALTMLAGCGAFWNTYSETEFPDAPPETFDGSQYTYSYSAQAFQLKPHDRQWILQSITTYGGDGVLLLTKEYQYDSNGYAWFADGDKRRYLSHVPRQGMNNPTEIYAGFDATREEYDEYHRITLREAYAPYDRAVSEYIQFYYCPSKDPTTASVIDSLCGYARAHRIVFDDPEEAWVRFNDGTPCMEDTGYEFMNYDHYGNEIDLFLQEGEYCLVSDSDGYLQLVIERLEKRYFVCRVDSFGRPLWKANYDRENGMRYDYEIWSYTDLSETA